MFAVNRGIASTSRGLRAICTTSRLYAVGRQTPSTPASQPVLKKDVPAAPSPPLRPAPRAAPTPASALTTPSGGEKKRSGDKEGSVYASYKALPYNTKLVFWACGAMIAVLGLLAADKLEELFPARNNRPRPASDSTTGTQAKFIDDPSTGEGAEEPARKPKLFSISVVDRK